MHLAHSTKYDCGSHVVVDSLLANFLKLVSLQLVTSVANNRHHSVDYQDVLF
jgi:hypothetical protein